MLCASVLTASLRSCSQGLHLRCSNMSLLVCLGGLHFRSFSFFIDHLYIRAWTPASTVSPFHILPLHCDPFFRAEGALQDVEFLTAYLVHLYAVLLCCSARRSTAQIWVPACHQGQLLIASSDSVPLRPMGCPRKLNKLASAAVAVAARCCPIASFAQAPRAFLCGLPPLRTEQEAEVPAPPFLSDFFLTA